MAEGADKMSEQKMGIREVLIKTAEELGHYKFNFHSHCKHFQDYLDKTIASLSICTGMPEKRTSENRVYIEHIGWKDLNESFNEAIDLCTPVVIALKSELEIEKNKFSLVYDKDHKTIQVKMGDSVFVPQPLLIAKEAQLQEAQKEIVELKEKLFNSHHLLCNFHSRQVGTCNCEVVMKGELSDKDRLLQEKDREIGELRSTLDACKTILSDIKSRHKGNSFHNQRVSADAGEGIRLASLVLTLPNENIGANLTTKDKEIFELCKLLETCLEELGGTDVNDLDYDSDINGQIRQALAKQGKEKEG